MLKQHNIDAVCCEQLEELIEQLRSSTFDVLLTDIQMPAINGFDLVKLLRASNLRKPGIIRYIEVRPAGEWVIMDLNITLIGASESGASLRWRESCRG